MKTNATRRAFRTLFQISLVEAVIVLIVAFGVDLSAAQIAAILGISTPIVTFIQNLLEDEEKIPDLLR